MKSKNNQKSLTFKKNVKDKKLKDCTDQELLNEIARRSKSKKGLPIKVKCSQPQCSEEFWIKWNQSTQNHSKLHNFDYWSGRKEDKNSFICSSCLRSLYYNKPVFWKLISDPKRRKILSGYVSNILD